MQSRSFPRIYGVYKGREDKLRSLIQKVGKHAMAKKHTNKHEKKRKLFIKLLSKSEFSKFLFMKVSESQTNSKQQSNAICI